MELEDLLSDSGRRTANIAVDTIGTNREFFKKVLDFALEDKGQYAMRAARVISLVAERNPELIKPYLDELVIKLPDIQNTGLRRGILKTLAESSLDLHEDSLGLLVDLCFGWMMDSQQQPAIKVYSMDILYKSCHKYPDLQPELTSSLESLLPRSSSGIKSRCKQLLGKLYQEPTNK